MESLNKAKGKFNHHLNDQAIKSYNLSNSDGKSLATRCQNTVKSLGYSLAVSIERVGELITLVALSTITLATIPAAIILLPSLLFKSNRVQEFVNFVFHLIKVEATVAKEIALNLALPLSVNPNITQAFAKQAKIHFENKDYSKAFAFAKAAANNGNVEAIYILGVIYGMNEAPPGTFSAAEFSEVYLKLAAKYNHPEAIIDLYQLNKHADYNKFLTKAVAINNPDALFDYARRATDPAVAKEYFQKAADLEHPEAINQLARINAKELTSFEGEEFNKVINLYSKAIEASKDDPSVYYVMYEKAELLEKAGQLEEAVAQYKEAESAYPKHYAINRNLPSPAFAKAKLHLQKGNAQAAIEELSKIEHKNIKAKILLASTHYKQNNLSKAVRIFDEVIGHFMNHEPLSKNDHQALVSILNLLYELHFHGQKDFKHNLEETRKYALLLADYDGNKENLYNASAMLLLGMGGPIDQKLGYAYLDLALEKGNANAAFLIGQLDVTPNPLTDPHALPINGLIYLKVAEKMGHKEAGKLFAKYSNISPKLLKVFVERENQKLRKIDQPELSGTLSEIIESESENILSNISKTKE